ncbi:tRNA (guanine-N(1)-)-methyltransferase [Sinomonas cellulolyticus]|uniref:tRNA (guanine-N(1)-)-methyltransferase n=1 Tax=Sinomonas cellulolyticus TaxID=2801916 RepID=A0ABS1K4H9_9MICC|nr:MULTISPECIES: tRNA (guanosine(37)-N1)-methyltransferase TrmD [Sinomonas]MBL0706378.1 tRNA (guanosine(37)-N1)-methyltransferase TrmD [Sinomonas cellulolyticus]GHG44318.1 tRNA (guanine-N(1)-)-methyltransferase [Sinomonas sp. KCTC 49339]
MRIDVVSIFPDYLAPLRLSLLGRAQEDGLLSLAVHDLRDFTFDRHHTVDDTPYGGGAGMVMKPEPWGLALEKVLAEQSRMSAAEGTRDDAAVAPRRPVLIVPSPAGAVFTQAMAYELAEEPTLAFACGRYEGIDERVLQWAAEGFDVRPVSIGDYVLNGGEVAVMAMVEAVGRLIPGVVGNPESLVEESHADGLLEYPVYTKPSSWRGLEVPEVLLSGNHGRIASWRLEQQLRRTAARRPELLDGADAAPYGKAERSVLRELGYEVADGKLRRA